MTKLVSCLGYCPKRLSWYEPPNVISPSEISIVIPVKNNHLGIKNFLKRFVAITPKFFQPLEIIIVDNNSTVPINKPLDYPIPLIFLHCSTKGPAAARNLGVSIAKGAWVLFTDSDCAPTNHWISGYCTTSNTALAYAGMIEIDSSDIISRYYKTQKILLPPDTIDSGKVRPDYLVTANCLVQKRVFDKIGGFDQSFTQAGGEDIDLAFRLLQYGNLEFQYLSLIQHNFNDGLIGFICRFIRYGRGNRQLAEKYQLNLQPKPFLPNKQGVFNFILALIQYLSMLYGYFKGGQS